MPNRMADEDRLSVRVAVVLGILLILLATMTGLIDRCIEAFLARPPGP